MKENKTFYLLLNQRTTNETIFLCGSNLTDCKKVIIMKKEN